MHLYGSLASSRARRGPLGRQRFHISLWTLFVYPMVRYAIWAAISMFLVTVVHPIFAVRLVAWPHW